MIGFEISHNGNVIAVVGGKDFFGLNAVLMACGDLNGVPDGVLITFIKAMGMAKGPTGKTSIHHSWDISDPEKAPVKVGDSITIRIIETSESSPPTSTQEFENENEEAEPDSSDAKGRAVHSGSRLPHST